MPRINFSHVDSGTKYPPIPEGKYRCFIKDVEERQTRSGDEMWTLRLEVVDTKYAGRLIFDNIIFSERGIKKVKCFCMAIGINVDGEIELAPDVILGKTVMAKVLIKEYTNRDGLLRRGNEVVFGGYSSVGDAKDAVSAKTSSSDDLPF